MTRRNIALLSACALVAAAACQDERSTVLEPTAGVSYGFALTPQNSQGLPRGTVDYIRPLAATLPGDAIDSSIVVNLAGLDSLVTKRYQVWLADIAADSVSFTNLVKATGRLRVIRTDSSVNQLGDIVATENVVTTNGVSSFRNGGSKVRIELTVNRASLGGTANPQPRRLVLVSLEDNDQATTPSSIRPLWSRRESAAAEVAILRPGTAVQVGMRARGNFRFGNFAIKPIEEYVFLNPPAGRGRGAIFNDVVLFNDSSLMRPPVGYYYAGALIKRDTTGRITDTLNLGPQTAPAPRRNVSLRDADVNADLDPVIQTRPQSIIAASSRLSADTVPRLSGAFPFARFVDAYVTLESKYGAESLISPSVVLQGNIPGIVTNGGAR
jgi:hypothetical protein